MSHLSFVPAAPSHAALLHQLYQATPSYFALVGGHLPTLGEVERDLQTAAADPNRRLELLYDGRGHLVGSVDYKTNYPEAGDVMLNLLLIRGDRQGRGLGTQALRQLERRHASEQRRILASVLGSDPQRARFWERHGYHFALDARPVMVWYAKTLRPRPTIVLPQTRATARGTSARA